MQSEWAGDKDTNLDRPATVGELFSPGHLLVLDYLRSAANITNADNATLINRLESLSVDKSVVHVLSHFPASVYVDGRRHGEGWYILRSGAAPDLNAGATIPINESYHLENTFKNANLYQWGVLGSTTSANSQAAIDGPALNRAFRYACDNNIESLDITYVGRVAETINVSDSTGAASPATINFPGRFECLGEAVMDSVFSCLHYNRVNWDELFIYGAGGATYSNRVVRDLLRLGDSFNARHNRIYARYCKRHCVHIVTASNAVADNSIATDFGHVTLTHAGVCPYQSATEINSSYTHVANTPASGGSESLGQRTEISVTTVPEFVEIDDCLIIDGKTHRVLEVVDSSTVKVFPWIDPAASKTLSWMTGVGLRIQGTKANLFKLPMTIVQACGRGVSDAALYPSWFDTLIAEFNGIGWSRGGFVDGAYSLNSGGGCSVFYCEGNTVNFAQMTTTDLECNIASTMFSQLDTDVAANGLGKVFNLCNPATASYSESTAYLSLIGVYMPTLGVLPAASYPRDGSLISTLELRPDRNRIAIRANNRTVNFKVSRDLHRLTGLNKFYIEWKPFTYEPGGTSNTLTLKVPTADIGKFTIEGVNSFTLTPMNRGYTVHIQYIDAAVPNLLVSLVEHLQAPIS